MTEALAERPTGPGGRLSPGSDPTVIPAALKAAPTLRRKSGSRASRHVARNTPPEKQLIRLSVRSRTSATATGAISRQRGAAVQTHLTTHLDPRSTSPPPARARRARSRTAA